MNSRKTFIQAPKRIGIVGGGASAALFVIECRRRLDPSIELVVFDPTSETGRGRAYAGPDRGDLLNVPAALMSARSDDPQDFVEWLKTQGRSESSFEHWPYVNRAVYGDYIVDRVNSVPFVHIAARVIAVQKENDRFALTLDSQAMERVDALIVATGYRSPDLSRDFAALVPVRDRVMISLDDLSNCQKSDEILIVGTGLTAIDVWRRVRNAGDIQVDFISRRGLFPIAHEDAPVPIQIPKLDTLTPVQILRLVRNLKRETQAGWPSLAIAIRAQVRAIWRAWEPRERRRFFRHLRPYWEVIRHRMPQGIRAELDHDLKSGRVRVMAGRVKFAQRVNGRIQLELGLKNSSEVVAYTCDRIALAVGAPIDEDLDLGGLGNERGLWFIGPPARSTLWEITALPDIREQVRQVVSELANG